MKFLREYQEIMDLPDIVYDYRGKLLKFERIIEIRHETGRVCTTVIATIFKIQGGQVNL